MTCLIYAHSLFKILFAAEYVDANKKAFFIRMPDLSGDVGRKI